MKVIGFSCGAVVLLLGSFSQVAYLIRTSFTKLSDALGQEDEVDTRDSTNGAQDSKQILNPGDMVQITDKWDKRLNGMIGKVEEVKPYSDLLNSQHVVVSYASIRHGVEHRLSSFDVKKIYSIFDVAKTAQINDVVEQETDVVVATGTVVGYKTAPDMNEDRVLVKFPTANNPYMVQPSDLQFPETMEGGSGKWKWTIYADVFLEKEIDAKTLQAITETSYGDSACPNGKQRIKSTAMCRQAGQYRNQWKFDSSKFLKSEHSIPLGCVSDTSKGIFFNQESSTTKSDRYSLICQKACTVAQCSICNDDVNTCEQCNMGYRPSGSKTCEATCAIFKCALGWEKKSDAALRTNQSNSECCKAILCTQNYRVVSKVCTACPAGKTNGHGDDASGADTVCHATTCKKNEQVVDHECKACPAGTTSNSGQDASGANTKCAACTVAQCSNCDGDVEKCRQCNTGHLLSRPVTCEACPTGCKTCLMPRDSNICETCNDGYYLHGTTCSECPDGCKTCNPRLPSKCQSCNHGFDFEDSTCQKFGAFDFVQFRKKCRRSSNVREEVASPHLCEKIAVANNHKFYQHSKKKKKCGTYASCDESDRISKEDTDWRIYGAK